MEECAGTGQAGSAGSAATTLCGSWGWVPGRIHGVYLPPNVTMLLCALLCMTSHTRTPRMFTTCTLTPTHFPTCTALAHTYDTHDQRLHVRTPLTLLFPTHAPTSRLLHMHTDPHVYIDICLLAHMLSSTHIPCKCEYIPLHMHTRAPLSPAHTRANMLPSSLFHIHGHSTVGHLPPCSLCI